MTTQNTFQNNYVKNDVDLILKFTYLTIFDELKNKKVSFINIENSIFIFQRDESFSYRQWS